VKRPANGSHTSGSTEFGDQSPSRLERPKDARKSRRLVFDPVKHGVAEHRVKLLVERKVFDPADLSVYPPLASGLYLLGACVNSQDKTSCGDYFLRQSAISTSEIQRSLSRRQSEQFKKRLAKIGDESGVSGIDIRIPALLRHYGFMLLISRNHIRKCTTPVDD
jgi:hypothetical protein